jgi:hypothetical protein
MKESADDLAKGSLNSRAGLHSQNELFPPRGINSCDHFPTECRMMCSQPVVNYATIAVSADHSPACVRLWHRMKRKRVTRSQELYNACTSIGRQYFIISWHGGVSSVNFSLAALCGLWRRRAIHSARSSGRTRSALKPISEENPLDTVVSDGVCFSDI